MFWSYNPLGWVLIPTKKIASKIDLIGYPVKRTQCFKRVPRYENPSEYFYHLDKFFELWFAIFHPFHMQKLSYNLPRKMFSNPLFGIVIIFNENRAKLASSGLVCLISGAHYKIYDGAKPVHQQHTRVDMPSYFCCNFHNLDVQTPSDHSMINKRLFPKILAS